jgi:hypothetical protein
MKDNLLYGEENVLTVRENASANFELSFDGSFGTSSFVILKFKPNV